MMPPQDYFDNPEFQTLEGAFHEYVAQGNGRNVTWLVQRTGLSLSTCARGMVKGFWLQRIQQIGTDAAKVTRELVGDVAGLNTRDVAALTEFIDATDAALLEAIRDNRCSPATLAKINFDARQRRREALGLGAGQEGDLMSRMTKLLEGATTDDNSPAAKPFVLDQKKLEAPTELPSMPGMTSDADEGRELDDDEKDQLRG